VAISAKTGRGVKALLDKMSEVGASFRQRVKTGELNRFFEEVLATRPPPTMSGRAPRLFYITQAETAPPLFVVMTNEPEYLHFSYQRFVVNRIRQTFGFEGVPIKVSYKKRRRRGEDGG
jgi:GTP-binding protein